MFRLLRGTLTIRTQAHESVSGTRLARGDVGNGVGQHIETPDFHRLLQTGEAMVQLLFDDVASFLRPSQQLGGAPGTEGVAFLGDQYRQDIEVQGNHAAIEHVGDAVHGGETEIVCCGSFQANHHVLDHRAPLQAAMLQAARSSPCRWAQPAEYKPWPRKVHGNTGTSLMAVKNRDPDGPTSSN